MLWINRNLIVISCVIFLVFASGYLVYTIVVARVHNSSSQSPAIDPQQYAALLTDLAYDGMVLSALKLPETSSITDVMVDARKQYSTAPGAEKVFVSENVQEWRNLGGPHRNDVAVWTQFSEPARGKRYIYRTFGNDWNETGDIDNLIAKKGEYLQLSGGLSVLPTTK